MCYIVMPPLQHSDARGFFTGKKPFFLPVKKTLYFLPVFLPVNLPVFLPVKNTSVYVTLTMLIKYSVHCRVQCTALLEMS